VGEIGWGRAFGYAVRYVIYVFAWWIIGGILMGIGFILIASSTVYYGWIKIENYGLLIGGIIMVFIGLVIAMLGSLATYFKLMSRLVRESVPETSRPQI